MKIALITLCLVIVSPSLISNKSVQKSFDGRAYDASLKMDFTLSSEQEIKTYYNYDSLVNQKGNELKQSLYDVISKNNYFIDYGSGTANGVNKWYKITDRNWELSRSIDPDTYLFSEDTKDNYYLVLAYYEDTANQDKTKAINSYVNSFTVDKTITAVDYALKKRPNSFIQEDKEHLWAKNHGFAPGSDSPCPGAGTDLHHLVAADHNTNSAAHNDLFYGEVVDKNASTSKERRCYYANGDSAISGWTGLDKNGETVFEPTDEWKGDIARALFYMDTRYSLYKECNSEAEPYLVLTDNNKANDNFISEDNLENCADKETNYLYHGIQKNLSTLLTWNELDPVSNYEVKRNDLIYKNVQRNRNPFVDYPSFAKIIYDSSTIIDDNPSQNSTIDNSIDDENTNNDSQAQESENEPTPNAIDTLLDNKAIIIIVIIILITAIILVIILCSSSSKNKKHRR